LFPSFFISLLFVEFIPATVKFLGFFYGEGNATDFFNKEQKAFLNFNFKPVMMGKEQPNES
jgi:hypothetical protein